MQQIVNVTIDQKGNAIPDSKSIGLQYETGVTRYAITPDPSWVSDQYFYYMIVSPPEDSDNKQYAVPLVNQGGTFIFEISSGITWHVGNYKFAFLAMSKEMTDGIVLDNGIVGISESWNGKITKSILDYISLQKQPVDANFQLLYTDLMALSVEVRNKANYAQEQGDYAKKTADDILAAKEAGEFDGKDGVDGVVGRDGVSPTFVTEQVEGGAKLTITDVNGTHEVFLEDGPRGLQGETGPQGEPGPQGPQGDAGPQGIPGKDGVTPHIGNNGNWFIGSEDTGISAKGIPGEPGKDGITPHIGGNGNWFIGDEDTGISATGSGGGSGGGTGDMLVAIYDKNGNGIVDNAEKVNGHTVEKDVPADAKFTDTIQDLTPYALVADTYTRSETDTKIQETIEIAESNQTYRIPEAGESQTIETLYGKYVLTTVQNARAKITSTPLSQNTNVPQLLSSRSIRWSNLTLNGQAMYITYDGVQKLFAFNVGEGISDSDSETIEEDILELLNNKLMVLFPNGNIEFYTSSSTGSRGQMGLRCKTGSVNEIIVNVYTGSDYGDLIQALYFTDGASNIFKPSNVLVSSWMSVSDGATFTVNGYTDTILTTDTFQDFFNKINNSGVGIGIRCDYANDYIVIESTDSSVVEINISDTVGAFASLGLNQDTNYTVGVTPIINLTTPEEVTYENITLASDSFNPNEVAAVLTIMQKEATSTGGSGECNIPKFVGTEENPIDFSNLFEGIGNETDGWYQGTKVGQCILQGYVRQMLAQTNMSLGELLDLGMSVNGEEISFPALLPENTEILFDYIYAVDDSQDLTLILLTATIGEKSYSILGYPGGGALISGSSLLATQEYVDSKKQVFTATIPTAGWTTGEQIYVDVTVTGMLESDIPHITPAYTNVKATDDAIQEAWNKIKRASTKDGGLRVYAEEIPTTEIPIQIEVVR